MSITIFKSTGGAVEASKVTSLSGRDWPGLDKDLAVCDALPQRHHLMRCDTTCRCIQLAAGFVRHLDNGCAHHGHSAVPPCPRLTGRLAAGRITNRTTRPGLPIEPDSRVQDTLVPPASGRIKRDDGIRWWRGWTGCDAMGANKPEHQRQRQINIAHNHHHHHHRSSRGWLKSNADGIRFSQAQ